MCGYVWLRSLPSLSYRPVPHLFLINSFVGINYNCNLHLLITVVLNECLMDDWPEDQQYYVGAPGMREMDVIINTSTVLEMQK